MTGPNFYTIDFDREIVLQGKSTTFVTIARNDSAGVTGGTGNVYVMIMPNTRTFETYYAGTGTTGAGANSINLYNGETGINGNVNKLSFNNVDRDMSLKNSFDFYAPSTLPTTLVEYTVSSVDKINYDNTVLTLEGSDFSITPATWNELNNMYFGHWNDGGNQWKINGKSVADLEKIAYTTPSPAQENLVGFPNIFDGTVKYFNTDNGDFRLHGTGYVGREYGGWGVIKYDPAVQILQLQ